MALAQTGNGYSFARSIAIAHAQVPNTDQSNFPVLFNTTDVVLKSATNGGHVQNANGYDIIFTSDAAVAVKLNHEIEYYNAATGQFVAWVRVPTVSHATPDTVIYLFYGNSSVSASQENATGVWDSNYKGVWHMGDNGPNTTVKDSTSNNNGNDSVNTSTRTTAGQIDGALLFQSASGNWVSLGNSASLHVSSTFTFQAWVNLASTPTGAYGLLTCANTIGYNYAFLINNNRSFQYRENNSTSGAGNNIGFTVPLNAWAFVTATFDGTNIRFYQNDALFTTAASALGDSTLSGCFMGGSFTSSNYYFDGKLDEIRLSSNVRSADWIAAEYHNQNSPTSFYSLGSEQVAGGQVVSPTFSPTAGTYTSGQMVTISSTTSGATIRYTTDGSTPTETAGTLYSTPVAVGGNTTLKAIAYATGVSDSTVATAAYTISSGGGSNGYSYHRTITILHSQVPNSDQTNFPVLFNTTDALLKTMANGGHVQSANGYDIIFTSDVAGSVKLNHEIEYYDPATGQFVAWVRVPTVSHAAPDTVIYLFYDNPGIAASQENPNAVWDSNYKGVAHGRQRGQHDRQGLHLKQQWKRLSQHIHQNHGGPDRWRTPVSKCQREFGVARHRRQLARLQCVYFPRLVQVSFAADRGIRAVNVYQLDRIQLCLSNQQCWSLSIPREQLVFRSGKQHWRRCTTGYLDLRDRDFRRNEYQVLSKWNPVEHGCLRSGRFHFRHMLHGWNLHYQQRLFRWRSRRDPVFQ
jgi:hypothetical protein